MRIRFWSDYLKINTSNNERYVRSFAIVVDALDAGKDIENLIKLTNGLVNLALAAEKVLEAWNRYKNE